MHIAVVANITYYRSVLHHCDCSIITIIIIMIIVFPISHDQFHYFFRKINFSSTCAYLHVMRGALACECIIILLKNMIWYVYYNIIIVPTVSRVSSRFDWQSVSLEGTTPSHVVAPPSCCRHVNVCACTTLGPGCGRGSVAPSRQHTHCLNTFNPSPVHVNPHPYAGTAFKMCGE